MEIFDVIRFFKSKSKRINSINIELLLYFNLSKAHLHFCISNIDFPKNYVQHVFILNF